MERHLLACILTARVGGAWSPSSVYVCLRTSLGTQTVERLSAMRETWVRSLGWEDPLYKETAAHSSALAWKIPWM